MEIHKHVACVVSKNVSKGSETRRECEKKTYAKEKKLGKSAKNKEQREAVKREKETPATILDILPNPPKHAALPWGANCYMRTNDN